ncbi:hypothetical protein G6514_001584 [Epicoccum nigrum]|nr:hypothetical protein G6514_001584 [Epicoccum nigrum]
MRLATLAVWLPIAITTAFPIAPAVIQDRAAETIAEAIVDPPHHSGAVNVPLPPRNAIVDPPPHHSGAVNVPISPRDSVKRSALAKLVCPYIKGHRYCAPSARDD